MRRHESCANCGLSLKYKIHFKLTKHKQESGFTMTVDCKEKDLQGEKEHWAMYFEKHYGTPVKVEKIEEVKE